MESHTAEGRTQVDRDTVDQQVDRDTVDFAPIARQFKRLSNRLRLDRAPGDAWVFAAACLAAVVLGLWLTSGAWGGGPPAGDDVTAYVIRTDWAVDHLVPRLRVDGWQPSFMNGYQGFLFLGPGSTWAIALTRLLTLGMLSTVGAVKVVGIVSFVSVPLTVAFVARSFGLSRRAAGISAILSLAVNNPFGGGLQAMYNIGLIAQQVAVPFFFLALGGIVRLVRDPRPAWTLVTAVSVAALVVTHTPSLAVLGLLVVIILAASAIDVRRAGRQALETRLQREVDNRLRALGVADEEALAAAVGAPDPTPSAAIVDRQSVVRIGVALAAGGALGACVLLPAFGHRGLQGPFIGWGTPPLGERLSQVWSGEFLLRPGAAFFVVMGLVYGAIRVARGRPFALALLVTPLAYMVAAHVLQHEWPSSLVMQQLSNRGIGYAGILVLLPLGALMARAGRSLDSAGDLLAVAAAVAFVVVPLGTTRDLAREMMVPVPQMREAARELAKLVPDHARFATQRDYPGEITRTNMIHPDRWLAWASGRNTLNIFHATSSVAAGPAFETDHIVDRPAEEVARSLSRYGVTHLVTVSDQAADQIGTSERFTTVWRASPLAIHSIAPDPGQPDPAALLTADGPISARVVESGPEKLRVEVDADRPSRAQIPVTWSPKWHARLDGRSVPLQRTEQGLLAVAVPQGAHRLDLAFRPDVWDWAGVFLTLATVALGAMWLRRAPRSATWLPEGPAVPGPAADLPVGSDAPAPAGPAPGRPA